MSDDWWDELLNTLEDFLRDTEDTDLNPAQRDAIGAIVVLYEGIDSCMKKYPDSFD